MKNVQLIIFVALWRIRSRKTIFLQDGRLQQSNLEPELCRFHCRFQFLHHRLRTHGCYQDQDTKPKLRGQGEWFPHRRQHGEAGRLQQLLQGIDPQAFDDWTQVDLLLLAGTNAYSSLLEVCVKGLARDNSLSDGVWVWDGMPGNSGQESATST